MPLSPAVKQLLEQLSKVLRFKPDIDVNKFREGFNMSSQLLVKMANEPIYKTEDITIPTKEGTIRARIYRPSDRERLPAVVFYHGGGFVLGSIETHDHVCRRISRLSGAVVVSVDYRLAPEHKFPAAVHDAYESAKWVADNYDKLGIDNGKIAVAGDSAGGNLATVTAIMARDHGEDFVKYQVLIYPAVNLSASPTISRVEYSGEEYVILTSDLMSWFGRQYLSKFEDAFSPYASPIFAKLSGLPPALIITAEYDPLRDEGELYGYYLKVNGVRSTVVRYNGVIHGFVNFYPILEEGKEAISQIAISIRTRFEEP
ncbi:Esterase/lipase [Pyrobaculum oguniense TE7]|uniref:Esterase/lipase n=1 Tax=Pyrobaculum oguniense (strain DSM 13380 / JCM 10595 / TE7) TaxID=698757 RepID=H6QDT2_PYROT|nr:Esterase/lipase [Pyrobaculum oguniense TE7]